MDDAVEIILLRAEKALIMAERDRTFAIMLERVQRAEAKLATARAEGRAAGLLEAAHLVETSVYTSTGSVRSMEPSKHP